MLRHTAMIEEKLMEWENGGSLRAAEMLEVTNIMKNSPVGILLQNSA